MQRSFTPPYTRLTEEAFDQARRQQDGIALAACRREQWWAEESFDRQSARRRARTLQNSATSRDIFDSLDLKGMLRKMASDQGLGIPSDQELEAMLPEFEHQVSQALARMEADELDSEELEPDDGGEKPPARRRGRRRTFMDL